LCEKHYQEEAQFSPHVNALGLMFAAEDGIFLLPGEIDSMFGSETRKLVYGDDQWLDHDMSDL
jgi:hypothetical protein